MSNNDHNKLNLGDQSDFWGKTSRFALIASALGYMGAPGIASANDDIQQEAPSAQAQSEPESDRNLIIVTATKREQSIVETPIAVTVVDAEMLVRTGVSDITNLERAAASYQMNSSDSTTGGLTLRLRGIGTTGNNIGIESSVGAFVDGFYIPRPGAVLGELDDVQQVEVLRARRVRFLVATLRQALWS
ncbi:MAG: Plug domain-containing protein [Sphingomonadales bacterium]|nr:Plug domain-containing protein [Sphingomonadales bacterium]